jgi:hypothetical protein
MLLIGSATGMASHMLPLMMKAEVSGLYLVKNMKALLDWIHNRYLLSENFIFPLLIRSEGSL